MKIALALGLAAAAASAALSLPTLGTPGAPPAAGALEPDRTVEVTGTVGRWRLEDDGNVLVRLDRAAGTDAEGLSEKLWFRMTPRSSATIPIERMLLDTLLAFEAMPDRAMLTFTGKIERGLDGSSREEALPLLALDRMTQP